MDYQEDKKNLGIDDIDRLSLNANGIPSHTPDRDMRTMGNKAVSTANSPVNPADQNVATAPNTAPISSPSETIAPEPPTTTELPMPDPNRSPAQQANYGKPTPELGQVVSLEMPPGVSPEQTSNHPEPQSSSSATNEPQGAPSTPTSHPSIKTTNRLNEHGVKNIDDAISKLGQDGNIADFYDLARDMMEENLENSYQRKLAA